MRWTALNDSAGRRLAVVLGSALALAACGDDDGDGEADAAVDAQVEVDMNGGTDSGPPDLGQDMPDPGCIEGCEIEEVSAGFDFSCARRANGEVLCWGGNLFGQLGDGSTRHGAACGMTGVEPKDCAADPQSVVGVTATSIDSESVSTCGLIDDGTLMCWGLADAPEEGASQRERRFTPEMQAGFEDADSFAKGVVHTCTILSDGTAECSGQNESGQLGDGDFVEQRSPVAVGTLTGLVEIDLGGEFSCARSADTVWCWGDNQSGQLGDDESHSTCGTMPNTYDCSGVPVEVAFVDASLVEQIDLGAAHACAVMTDGTVQCWGFNAAGQAGVDVDATSGEVATPTEVSGLTGAAFVDAGFDTTCAILDDGSVTCWGANDEGQLGDGEEVGSHTTCGSVRGDDIDCSAMPVDVSVPEAVVDLAVGSRHVCVAGTSGKVWCWGWNDQRQLGPNGDAGRNRSISPVEVTGF